MSMTIKHSGKVVAAYKPQKKQWWITSFNPYFQNVNAESLTAIFTVNFSARKKLFNDFYDKYGTGRYKSPMWKFQKSKWTATLSFK